MGDPYSGRDWLRQYDQHRQHTLNRRLHAVGLPLAALGLLMLLWSLRLPTDLPLSLRLLNPALLAVMVLVAYGFLIGPLLALCMACLSIPVLLLLNWLDREGLELGWSGIGLIFAGWLLLVAGHRHEGNRPVFLGRLQYLPVGLYWLLDCALRRLLPD
jgi:uncharacterized membrane protein YGL010W